MLAILAALAIASQPIPTTEPQFSTEDLVVFATDANVADVMLVLRDPLSESAVPAFKFQNQERKRLIPQPTVTTISSQPATVRISVSNLFYWGRGWLTLTTKSGTASTYQFQRGPKIDVSDVDIRPDESLVSWIYNYETREVPVSARLVAGNRSPDDWTEETLLPASTVPIRLKPPVEWFSYVPWTSAPIQAQLQLRFGRDTAAPILTVPFRMQLTSNLSVWRSNRAAQYAVRFVQFVWVILGVTIGAVLLMMAQVLIPNFRRILRLENQADSLQERLRALSGRIGDQLYTRCQKELLGFRLALAMPQTAASNQPSMWDRVALSGNSSEVDRLDGLLRRIENRVELTERLDELQAETLELDMGSVPPSVCWDRTKQLRSVQGILSRQLVNDVDEKAASSSLDLLADGGGWMKAFGADLDARIAGLRRQFEIEPYKSKGAELAASVNGAARLLIDTPPSAPQGGWSVSELIARDLAAVRMGVIFQMVSLEELLKDKTELIGSVVSDLQSNDPFRLANARLNLTMLSEGVFPDAIREALNKGAWDTNMEPVTVTTQDVVRVWFTLRDNRLNRATAKTTFSCWWCVSTTNSSENDVYEEGWEIQLLPGRLKTTLSPQVYVGNGEQVQIRQEEPKHDAGSDTREQVTLSTKPKKGSMTFTAEEPPKNTFASRLIRGLIDASLTALVPVVTVVVTQLRLGTAPSFLELVLIGFSSQAIRSAIVPQAGYSSTVNQKASAA